MMSQMSKVKRHLKNVVRADPVRGDVDDKTGNEEALVEMQEVNNCEGQNLPTIVLPRKSRCF